VLGILLLPSLAHADGESGVPEQPKITPIAYVEAHYSYNFARPPNGITAYRGFDNRHNTFTLSNVAVGAAWEAAPDLSGRVVLQVGHTPSSYYANEPALRGAAGTNGTDGQLWKLVQEGFIGYRPKKKLLLQLGLFLSPIGPESMAVKDNWTWSRSNLFFALPYYHAGLRGSYELSHEWTATLAVYNGWNNVVDDNEAKSVSSHLTYAVRDLFTAQLLYFGGVERPAGSPEGPYWRHLFDAWAKVEILGRIALMAHANGGWEPNRFGTSAWAGGALYARVQTSDWLALVLRVDRFWEDVGASASGRARPLFWGPTDSGKSAVASITVTAEARPRDNFAVRLEYRHDEAESNLYFARRDPFDPGQPNARSQDTLTLGATTWIP
jgi:hypothetical protein